MEWNDPATGNTSIGYREQGYLPEAFLNMLLLLGWSSGDDEELYTLEEAVAAFDLPHVVKAGAVQPQQTLWFNEQYLRQGDTSRWIDHSKWLPKERMAGPTTSAAVLARTPNACSSCTKSRRPAPLRRAGTYDEKLVRKVEARDSRTPERPRSTPRNRSVRLGYGGA